MLSRRRGFPLSKVSQHDGLLACCRKAGQNWVAGFFTRLLSAGQSAASFVKMGANYWSFRPRIKAGGSHFGIGFDFFREGTGFMVDGLTIEVLLNEALPIWEVAHAWAFLICRSMHVCRLRRARWIVL